MAGPICMKVFPAFLLLYPLGAAMAHASPVSAPRPLSGADRSARRIFARSRHHRLLRTVRREHGVLPGIGEGNNSKGRHPHRHHQDRHAIVHGDHAQHAICGAASQRSAFRSIGPGAVLSLGAGGGADDHCASGGAGGLPESRSRRCCSSGCSFMLMMFDFAGLPSHDFGWLIPVIILVACCCTGNASPHAWHRTTGWSTLVILNNVVHGGAHMDGSVIRLIFRDLGMSTWIGLAFGDRPGALVPIDASGASAADEMRITKTRKSENTKAKGTNSLGDLSCTDFVISPFRALRDRIFFVRFRELQFQGPHARDALLSFSSMRANGPHRLRAMSLAPIGAGRQI